MAPNTRGFRLHTWDGVLHENSWTTPGPAPGEVQIDVEACGVGATVLNNARGANWADSDHLPRVPGHELVGRVNAQGPGVATPEVGQRVVAYFYLSCFACRWCRLGREERCTRSRGRVGIHRDGGYATITNLPAGNALPLPSSLDPLQATVVADAVATPVHVCTRRLRLSKGETLAVVGAAGGVGAHLIQVALMQGARVFGIDRGDEKLELVESLGADPVDGDAVARGSKADLDDSLDAVVDLVGTEETLRWGLDRLGQGGRLCALTTSGDMALQLAPRELVSRELSVMGSHYATRQEVIEAARLVAEGLVRPVIGATVAPSDIGSLHERLRLGTLLGRGAIDWRYASAAPAPNDVDGRSTAWT